MNLDSLFFAKPPSESEIVDGVLADNPGSVDFLLLAYIYGFGKETHGVEVSGHVSYEVPFFSERFSKPRFMRPFRGLKRSKGFWVGTHYNKKCSSGDQVTLYGAASRITPTVERISRRLVDAGVGVQFYCETVARYKDPPVIPLENVGLG